MMNRHTGQRLGLREHLMQSVGDIICTPLGSRVMRRDYGSLVPELLDQPDNALTQLRVYAAAASALLRWEPRLRVTGLALVPGEKPGMSVLNITGNLNGTQASVMLGVPLGTDTAGART